MGRRLSADELLVATHNPGKLREVADLFGGVVPRIRSAADLQLDVPEEDGDTFEANAAIKARAAARCAGMVAVADDSGLVVPRLGGAPGVHAARWAGPTRDFGVAMIAVHDALLAAAGAFAFAEGETEPRAEMVCALALAWPDGLVEAFEGRVAGRLTWPPRGRLGFGYEPMFVPEGSARTYAEMSRAEKHADDPRARAFAKLRAACLA